MRSGYPTGKLPHVDATDPSVKLAQLESRTTDQWGYETAFRESEDRWRKLLELSTDGVYLQVDGRFVFVNSPMTKLLGEANTHDLIGRRVLEMIHPDDRESARHRMNMAMESGRTMSSKDQRFITLNGRAIHAAVSEAPVVYGGRQATQVIVTDLAARKSAEEALEVSREKFKALVQTINEGFAVLDERGVITHANYRFRNIVGFTLGELDGRSMPDLLEKASKEPFSKYFRSVKERNDRIEFEALLRNKDGRDVPALISLYGLRDREERFACAYVAITDITELRQATNVLEEVRKELAKAARPVALGPEKPAEKPVFDDIETQARTEPVGLAEERFRAVFQSTGDCAYVKDRSLQFVIVNSSMEKTFGLSQAQLIGKGLENLYGKQGAEDIRVIEKRVLLGEQIEGEHTRTVRGIAQRFHEIRVPIRGQSGAIVGLCGILRNLTEPRFQALSESDPTFEYRSVAMRSTLEKARQAAATDSVVLLQGESGSGKDFLARFIHGHSLRKKGPFFDINCAALSPELVESELFGHESGAFTGARSRKKGLVELAEGGTLLLNEVGELMTSMQPKLLTFLDSKKFMRVGGEKPVFVNTRIIAASHRDLKKEVAEGRFLKALYYRLNVFNIRLPALRERREDIAILVGELTAQLAQDMQWQRTPELAPDQIEALCRRSWPGNVRELRNVLERTLILWNSGQSDVASLSDDPSDEIGAILDDDESADLNVQRRRDELTYILCQEALRRSGGNKKLAAELLGVSRISFYRYLKTLNLDSDYVTER
jgi:PAS domain S-box-containing protein